MFVYTERIATVQRIRDVSHLARRHADTIAAFALILSGAEGWAGLCGRCKRAHLIPAPVFSGRRRRPGDERVRVWSAATRIY